MQISEYNKNVLWLIRFYIIGWGLVGALIWAVFYSGLLR